MILKRLCMLVVSLTAMVTAQAQHQQIVWSTDIQPLANNEYKLTLKGTIAPTYHMYDMENHGEMGPNPTTISFSTPPNATLIGELEIKGNHKRYYDDIFEMEIGTYSGTVEFVQLVKLEDDSSSATITASAEWMLCNDTTCLPPDDDEFIYNIGIEESSAAVAVAQNGGSSMNLWSLIIEAILWGFAALLTPCVFPMIPMTVSFFMKGDGGAAKGRLSASLYGLFIVALYTLPIAAIILITKWLGGDAVTADIFNWLATHWLPNIIFFVVFMVFAASFLGAFEITLPSWIVNKSDEKADRGSIGGIFFLALTLVLVSFSCTGPIVGSVLIKSTSGEFWSPIITMLAFSSAFALPFAIFAFFPSTLKSLPKSGGWLNSVKVVLGFVEIALGLKFLSVADQTYHWGLLDREVYLAIWIVVFAMMGLYLLGKLKFAHDSETQYISVGRLALAIATFSFVVYLIPGMWGAPLKSLSGYLPPMHTQDFVVGQYSGSAATAQASNPDMANAKYSDFLHLPHGLQGFYDVAEAEAYAKKVNKPLFVDFTGHGCVNCREMEARVWSDPQVLDILRNEYVIVALYMDDKRTLPESEWVTTPQGRTLKSLGKINSNYALTTYGINSQPYYILESPQTGEMLTTPRGYNLDTKAFIAFLQEGVAKYKAQQAK